MLIPVILSGGSGTRLWPLSREMYPKQLLPLVSNGTMLQETLARTHGMSAVGAPIVVCNEQHRFLVAEQLLEAGVIGSAELQRREAELQQAGLDLSAAAERLRVLGFQEDAISALQKKGNLSSITNVLSSIDGIVLERKATIGQIMQAVEPVFVIADLSHVWLVADVPDPFHEVCKL